MKPANVTAAQLEYLDAALEYATWKDAASALGVSASGFSQGIAELERRLGVTLFQRQGRRRLPTDEAREAGARAARVLAELRELERWAGEARSGSTGKIRAGMIDTAAVHHFGDALMRHRAQHPDVALGLTVRPSGELFELLRSGDLDVVVAVDPTDLGAPVDDLELHPLVVEPLFVYAPRGVLVGKPSEWGPWVSFPVDSRTRGLVARELRRLGAGFDVVAESSQPAVLREMVQLGMGWTVLSPVDAEREPHALHRAVPEPVAQRVLSLARRRDRVPSEAVARFITHLLSSRESGHR